MSHRPFAACLLTALIGLVPLAPTTAMADDLDDLMAGDPEREAPPKQAAEGDAEGEGEAAGQEEDAGFDSSMIDEERPPGDEDAFVQPDKGDSGGEAATDDDEATPFSVGLLVGYGFHLEGKANAWGFGFGARGAYDTGLFSFGLRFSYQLGEDKQVEIVDSVTNVVRGTDDQSRSLWAIGVDVGIDLDINDRVLFRPELGVGFAGLTTGGNSEAVPMLAPGLMLLYDATESIYVGIEARFEVLASDNSASGFVFMAHTGFMF